MVYTLETWIIGNRESKPQSVGGRRRPGSAPHRVNAPHSLTSAPAGDPRLHSEGRAWLVIFLPITLLLVVLYAAKDRRPTPEPTELPPDP